LLTNWVYWLIFESMKELEQLLNQTREGKVWVSISCKVDHLTKEKIRDHAAKVGLNLNRFLLHSLLSYIKKGDSGNDLGLDKVQNKLNSTKKKLDKASSENKSLSKELESIKKSVREKDEKIKLLINRYLIDMSNLRKISCTEGLTKEARAVGFEGTLNKFNKDFGIKKG